jgi:hypothetical protein
LAPIRGRFFLFQHSPYIAVRDIFVARSQVACGDVFAWTIQSESRARSKNNPRIIGSRATALDQPFLPDYQFQHYTYPSLGTPNSTMFLLGRPSLTFAE